MCPKARSDDASAGCGRWPVTRRRRARGRRERLRPARAYSAGAGTPTRRAATELCPPRRIAAQPATNAPMIRATSTPATPNLPRTSATGSQLRVVTPLRTTASIPPGVIPSACSRHAPEGRAAAGTRAQNQAPWKSHSSAAARPAIAGGSTRLAIRIATVARIEVGPVVTSIRPKNLTSRCPAPQLALETVVGEWSLSAGQGSHSLTSAGWLDLIP